MGLLDKLLGRMQPVSSEEAALIHFDFGPKANGDHFGFDDMVDLEEKLIAVIERHRVGELDGNEIGQTDGTIFTYGPDANRLFKVVEPILRGHPLQRSQGGHSQRRPRFTEKRSPFVTTMDSKNRKGNLP